MAERVGGALLLAAIALTVLRSFKGPPEISGPPVGMVTITYSNACAVKCASMAEPAYPQVMADGLCGCRPFVGACRQR